MVIVEHNGKPYLMMETDFFKPDNLFSQLSVSKEARAGASGSPAGKASGR